MRLDLSADQELFRDTTRRFLEDSCPVLGVRALADAGGGFDRAWWRQGAALGWTSLLVPDEHGGSASMARGLVDVALVAEVMGAFVSPGPLLPANVVAAALAASGSSEQKARVLPGLASGELVASWCLAEAAGGWRPDDVSTTAERRDGGFVLTGVKSPVEAADDADLLLVPARVDGELAQFLVPRSAPGLEIVPLRCLDLVRHYSEVRLSGVAVPTGALVGEIGRTAAEVEHLLAVALVLQCAEATGAAVRVLELTVEYSFDRFSFGRPLASYQALKHRFADMRLWSESCQATTDAAAVAVAERRPDALHLARVAKAYVGDHAPAIVQDCIQLHGSIGVTWEHDLHLYLRRVTVDRAVFGTPPEHRIALGSPMIAGSREEDDGT